MTPPTQDQINKEFNELWKEIDNQGESAIKEIGEEDGEILKVFTDTIKGLTNNIVIPGIEKAYNVGYQKGQEETIKLIDNLDVSKYNWTVDEFVEELKEKLLNNPQETQAKANDVSYLRTESSAKGVRNETNANEHNPADIINKLKEYLEPDYPDEKSIIIQEFIKQFLKEIDNGC